MFFPGETVIQTFIIPFKASEIDHVVISYEQSEQIVLEKTITSGFETDENDEEMTSFDVELSQEETLLFADDKPFSMQCNVFTVSGARQASHTISSLSGVQYLREVMHNAQ